ncbi:sensor histidine kinase [Streptococcus ovuberis]|nr:sensor histidine kinase [Streptococcus ovuberis]
MAWLLLYVALACLFLTTFWLYRLPMAYFANALIFALTLFVFFALGALMRFRKEWYSLRHPNPNNERPSSFSPLVTAAQEALQLERQKNQEQTETLLQELNQLKSLIKMWGHQIKVPLASLDLLVQTEKLNPQQVASQVQTIDHYLTILLTYLKFQDKTDDFRFERLHVRPIVSQIIKDYRVQCLTKDLSVHIEGDCILNSDAKWLSFALSQFIDNAIKYSKRGGKITISLYEKGIRIKDHGIGILAEDLPRLFDEGFTGFNGHKYHKSTGLGLFMAKKVLDDLELAITVESEVEQGTTVTLSPKRGIQDEKRPF